MKKLLCILLALSFILAGCSEEKEIHECDPRSCICVKDIGTLENMRETIKDESLDDQDFKAYIVEQEPGVIISEHQPLVRLILQSFCIFMTICRSVHTGCKTGLYGIYSATLSLFVICD